MSPRRIAQLAAAAAAVAVLGAGCGSDSSGETSSAATQVAIPSPTSPIATSPATTTAPAKKKQQGTETTGGVSPSCTIPDTYQDFKYSGVECSAALAIATAWDQNGKDCNTIDNPDSPDGYKRTCSVEGYTCTAKRDVHSDGRFVTCAQGGASIRFTWFPI